MNKKQVDYFDKITEQCDLLNEQGRAYLDRLPFINNEEVCERIFRIARKIFEDGRESRDAIPEWIEVIANGYIPYSAPPKNGSLHYSLGWAIVSQDAHLRNTLERIEGRETTKLNFGVLAPLPEIDEEE